MPVCHRLQRSTGVLRSFRRKSEDVLRADVEFSSNEITHRSVKYWAGQLTCEYFYTVEISPRHHENSCVKGP